MTSDQEESDFDFLDDIEQLSRFFTQVTYNFINHTNKTVGGSRIRAADLKKFSDDEWNKYYQDHYENYKLICREYLKNEFVIVEKKNQITKKELVNAFKKFLVDFFSQKPDENEEVAADKEITEEGKNLIQNELDPIDDLQQSPEAKMSTKYLSDVLDSLKRPEALEDLDGDLDELIVAGHNQSLDEGSPEVSKNATDSANQFAADTIDPSFDQFSQELDGNEKVNGDREIAEKEEEFIQKNEQDQLKEILEAKHESHKIESEHPKSDTKMGFSSYESDPEHNPLQPLNVPQKSSGVSTDFLANMLNSLKIRDTLPDSDKDQEDRWVAAYVRSLGEGLQEVYSSPVAAESTLNLDSQADFNLTTSELLEDNNSDETDEVDLSFEQKLKEQKENFEIKLAEARLKRAERQRQHDKELQEQQKALFVLKGSLKK